MNDYPTYNPKIPEDAQELLTTIIEERLNDVKDFDNLQNRFVLGRKTGKIPSGTTDISNTDRVGDINYDADYLYIIINNLGVAEWRRVALSSW